MLELKRLDWWTGSTAMIQERAGHVLVRGNYDVAR